MTQNGSETEKPSLTARQKRALPIPASASASAIAEAVRLSDVGRRTLHRWLDAPDFREGLAKLHKQAADLARSQESLREELQTLEDSLNVTVQTSGVE